MDSLQRVYIIAKNTFLEIIRDRILYGLFVFAFLLIGMSLVLGQLSFAEQIRISTDLGFAAIHIAAVIISIFVGSTLVSREIDKKTILTLLARPITRTQFLVGKSLGLLSVIVIVCVLVAMLLTLVLSYMGVTFNLSFAAGIYGVILEAAVLLAVTIFFGTFSSPMLSVSFCLGIFMVGHWIESLKYFMEKSGSPGFKIVAKSIVAIHPNLETFNWRSLFVYGDALNIEQVMSGTGYAFLWVLFLTTISSIILSRRDLA